MPSPAERKHPPRVTIELGVKGLVAPEVVGYQFYDFPHGTYEYVPLSEFEEMEKRLDGAEAVIKLARYFCEAGAVERCENPEDDLAWAIEEYFLRVSAPQKGEK